MKKELNHHKIIEIIEAIDFLLTMKEKVPATNKLIRVKLDEDESFLKDQLYRDIKQWLSPSS